MKASSLLYRKNTAAIEKALGPKKLKQILDGETSIKNLWKKKIVN